MSVFVRASLMLGLLVPLLAASGAPNVYRADQPPDHEYRAKRVFERAEQAALEGDPEGALERYQAVVRAYPKSVHASISQWEVVRLHEAFGDYVAAFDALQLLVDHFPGNFEKALQRQFEIALRCLNRYDSMERFGDGRKPKDLPEKEQVSVMLRIVIENGPYSSLVAEATYYLAVALEKEGKSARAAIHHEEFLERFPEHPFADDSAYQVSYILYKYWLSMKSASPTTRERASMALKWYLSRYPNSDKAAQARECLDRIANSERTELMGLARYYEGLGDERAAAVYYRELASKFPEIAPEGSPMRERIFAWMEKYPELKEEELAVVPTVPMTLPERLFTTPKEMGAEAFDIPSEQEEFIPGLQGTSLQR